MQVNYIIDPDLTFFSCRYLRKTTSNSSDGKSSTKERIASSDSNLDRDSDYSSMMYMQVAELEQQIM